MSSPPSPRSLNYFGLARDQPWRVVWSARLGQCSRAPSRILVNQVIGSIASKGPGIHRFHSTVFCCCLLDTLHHTSSLLPSVLHLVHLSVAEFSRTKQPSKNFQYSTASSTPSCGLNFLQHPMDLLTCWTCVLTGAVYWLLLPWSHWILSPLIKLVIRALSLAVQVYRAKRKNIEPFSQKLLCSLLFIISSNYDIINYQ